MGRRRLMKREREVVLSQREYDLLVEADYSLEPYKELCIVKAKDPFYRDAYERMLRTAVEIVGEERAKQILGKEIEKPHVQRWWPK